jgi:hypothetical protein
MTENLVVCSKCGTINRLPPSRPAIKHQNTMVRRPALHVGKQIGIERYLQNVFRPRGARQLGVPWFVRPAPARTAIINTHQKVGVAEPRP